MAARASGGAELTVEQLAAELYHDTLPEWPGEIVFYRELAKKASDIGPLLEVACGTGRISIDLARQGRQVTGFDLSEEMLGIARKMSAGLRNIRWVLADMRSFEMGERYGLVLIPGHSFQFMLTPVDQMACLTCIKHHLLPGGRLVVHLDHQDLGWLWNLYQVDGGKFKAAGEVLHPRSGNRVLVSRAWSYEPCTQTASVRTIWEERDAQETRVQRWERGPVALHCIFRFEMEHVLARAGFKVLGVYGSFKGTPLQDDSSEMIWVSEVVKESI